MAWGPKTLKRWVTACDVCLAGGQLYVDNTICDVCLSGGQLHDDNCDVCLAGGQLHDNNCDVCLAGGQLHDNNCDVCLAGGQLHDDNTRVDQRAAGRGRGGKTQGKTGQEEKNAGEISHKSATVQVPNRRIFFLPNDRGHRKSVTMRKEIHQGF